MLTLKANTAQLFSLAFVRSSLAILLLFTFSSFLIGQDAPMHAYNWFFGNGYGFDFSEDTVAITYDNRMATYETAVTMSDKNGDLLFYTNGGGREDSSSFGAIRNRNHEPMEGGWLGTRQGGGLSAAQGAVSFLKPGTQNEYYLFTVDEFETMTNSGNTFTQGKGLSYFEIDMNANGGLGRVTVSDQKLLQPSFEYLTATRHGNCEDFWVVAMTGYYHLARDAAKADSFYVFQVTPDGIEEPQVFPMLEGRPRLLDEYGMIRISPDGSTLIAGLFI